MFKTSKRLGGRLQHRAQGVLHRASEALAGIERRIGARERSPDGAIKPGLRVDKQFEQVLGALVERSNQQQSELTFLELQLLRLRAQLEQLNGSSQPAPVRATDAARQVALQLGVELEGIRGTGPEGLIVVRDVEIAAAYRAGQPGQV